MGRDIKKFVKSCPVCQRVKINKHEHVKPGSFPTEKSCFKTVQIDLVGLLPESKGFKYILTAIDRSSCYTIVVPLQFTEATEVWKQFKNNWIATFRVP